METRFENSVRIGVQVDDCGGSFFKDGSIGLANLPHLADVVYRHRQHARYYATALARTPGITLPPPDPGASWWLYTLLVDEGADARDDLIAFLAARGIAASPVHARNDRHTGFGGPLPEGALPGVDAFASREVAIPVGWWLSADDLEAVAHAVRAWATARAAQPQATPEPQPQRELVGAA